MTPRTMVGFDIDEIPALELQCGSCEAWLQIALQRRARLQTSQECPSCEAELWGHETDAGYKHVSALLLALNGWQKLKDKPFRIGVSIEYRRPKEK